ncbi:hypothetical protein Tco_0002998 [Tanacetum coccineum]
MTTLADKSLLSGGDNKPPMLEKHLYDSWKSRMELYMLNRPHGRMILASVEKGPLVWPSITEDGVTRLKEYIELTPAKAIQADCDIKKGHIAKQCTKPKRKGMETWFNDKCCWFKLKQVVSLTEEEISLLARSGVPTLQFLRLPRIALMENLSRNGSDALTEYLSELTGTVQNSNLFLLNKMLTTELDRYKEEVKDLKEMQNVENSFSGSNKQYTEIERLKQTLSKQVQEKDSLMKTVFDLKNDLKMEENRNIDMRNVLYESKPKLYDGNVILKMDAIMIPDFDETLMLYEESRSKMLLKEQDPMVVKHKVNTKPVNYVVLNNDYNKRFVRQSDLYSEHVYWTKAIRFPPLDPSPSSKTTKFEVPNRIQKTTAMAITEGTWGFEHTKACFRDEIIPFIKGLKDIFNNFNQYLVDEIADVQNDFYQMEQAIEQHRLESRTFEVKINQVLSKNERLLAQAIDYDIVKTIVNLSVNDGCETVNECQKCLEFKTELLNKKDFVDKETYDKLSQYQEKDTIIIKLKEQIKSLRGNMDDSKVKMDMDEIETLNIELEHRVTKLVAENEHLKQTYKQLYDSIKPKRVQSKEQCDALIKQVNIKSGEISDLNAKLQEQGLVIAALKNELRKLKGKALDKEAIETHSVDPNVSKDNVEPITPKLLNKRTAHSSYIKHTQEEALVLMDIVEHVKANYPQDSLLESAFSCGHIEEKGQERVRLTASATGSQPSGNTKNDKILQIASSNSKNKVEAHSRNVKSSLNKRNGTIKVNGSASVQNSKKHDNSDYVCINGDDCMSSDNLCVSNSMNDVKFRAKPKKRKSKKEI